MCLQLNVNVTSFQRNFVNEVRRCDEVERKLRYIEAEIKKDNIEIPDIHNDSPRAPNPRELFELEVIKNEFKKMNHSLVNILFII